MAEDANGNQSSFSPRRTASVLVGRAREQVFLREELAATISGHGRLVLLSGEAGIGKTTLAQDLVRVAAERDTCVLTGHCYDLTNTPPYGPWLDLVAGYPNDPELPSPPAAFAGGVLERVTDQAALFAEVRTFFAGLDGVGPTLVLLEDLHWADPASLELLRNVAPQLRQWSILLLATYRGVELTRRNPFSLLLPALVREAEPLRLDLRRLDVEALRALAAGRYGLPDQDATRLVTYLDQHAEGNPFFATELFRALEEEAILHQTKGGWVLGEFDRVVVPSLLRQVIEGRVARLGEDVRQPLAIAAVIGQEVPLALWAEVADLDDEMLLGIVEQAVEAHLLDAERDGVHVRFVHALTREALYEGVLPPRRRLWHRSVAETLIATGSPNPDAVAFHLQQAGDPRAWEWLTRAGERAQRAYAWLTARERFAAAASLLDGVAGEERTRGWLLYRCGRLQRYSRPTQGIDALAEAERLARAVDDRTLAADARYSRGLLHCYADDFRIGLEDLAAGVAALEALPVDEAHPSGTTAAWFADALPATEIAGAADFDPGARRLSTLGVNHRRGTLPWFLAAGGRLADAETIAETFLKHAQSVPQAGELVLSATGHAHQGLGIVHAMLGRPERARTALTHAREVYTALDHHAVIAFTLLCELQDVVLPYYATEVAERRRLAGEAEAALRRAGGALPADVSPRRAWLGILFLEGRWEEARAIAADTPNHGNYYLRRQVTGVLGLLARHRDEPKLAWAQIRSLLPAGPATSPGGCVFADALLCQRLAADLELDRGDLTAALTWLEANDRWLAWNGSVLGRADNRVVWARYFREAGDIERARASAAEALRAASQPPQPLALLAAHRLSGELAGLDRLADAEEHLAAALALADACAAPYERALTLLAIAELRLAKGAAAEGLVALDEARHICIPLNAVPALVRTASLAARFSTHPSSGTYPAGLTHREVEVLRLLAQRKTDKEIAETLFLGPRTVQSHVAHILNKLGVANRREAATAAERLGLL